MKKINAIVLVSMFLLSFLNMMPQVIGVAPTLTTDEATGVEEYNATLKGTISNDGGISSTGWFEYGLDTDYNCTAPNTLDLTTGELFTQNVSSTKKLSAEYNVATVAHYKTSQWLAMAFAPDDNYYIKGVALPLNYSDNPGEITVSIRATSGGKPTGGDLCSTTFYAKQFVPTVKDWVNITFDATYQLTKWTKYAIVMEVESNNLFWKEFTSGSGPNGSATCYSGDGSSWSYHTGCSLLYKVYEAVDFTPATVYHYRAISNNTDGTSYGTNETLLTRPLTPSVLAVTRNNLTGLNLTWTAGTGANNTYIERNTLSSWALGAGNLVYNDSGNTCNDSGLTENTEYFYQAWSYAEHTIGSNTMHQYSSSYLGASNSTYGTPNATTNNPTGITATNATFRGTLNYLGNDSEITAKFDYGLDPTYGDTTADQTMTAIGSFSQNVTLNAGTRYIYIAYVNNSYNGSYASAKQFLTLPNVSSSFSASAYNRTSVNLTWVKGAGANNTYVVRKLGGYPATRADGTNVYNGTASLFDDTGLEDGTQYYYSAWSYAEWTNATNTFHQFSSSYTTCTAITDNNNLSQFANESYYPLSPLYESETTIYFNVSIKDIDDTTVTPYCDLTLGSWHVNNSMTYVEGTNLTGANFTYATTIPVVGELTYFFVVRDAFGEWNTSSSYTLNVSMNTSFEVDFPSYLQVGQYVFAQGTLKNRTGAYINGTWVYTKIVNSDGWTTVSNSDREEWIQFGKYNYIFSTTTMKPGTYHVLVNYTYTGYNFSTNLTLYISYDPGGGVYSDAAVLFSFYNTNYGLGLPRETLKVYVNGSRLYNNVYYGYIGEKINVTIRDYYDQSLYMHNHTINATYYYMDLGLTFHSYKFCNKNDDYYMLSLRKNGATRWWERGLCPYETIEFLIPSGTYRCRAYDADNVELFNFSITVVNSRVYVIHGTNLSLIINGQSVIVGDLLELHDEFDYALTGETRHVSRNPPILFSIFDVDGLMLGEGIWTICPPMNVIATTKNNTFGNWINSTALIPGNGTVANGTITVMEDTFYFSSNGSVTWVNITYTDNGTSVQNTSYMPTRFDDLCGYNYTINASGDLNVQRITTYNQLKKFEWTYYSFAHGPLNRPGYHTYGLNVSNPCNTTLYDVYVFVGFSNETSPDLSTVVLKDIDNDGEILNEGENYRVSGSGIDFKITGSIAAEGGREFLITYYKETYDSIRYDEDGITVKSFDDETFDDEFFYHFKISWRNRETTSFRGGLYINLQFDEANDIDINSVVVYDEDSNTEIEDFIAGQGFIRIGSDAMGEIAPGGGRHFEVYFQLLEYPGANPLDIHVSTPIAGGLSICMILILFGVFLMGVGSYRIVLHKRQWKQYMGIPMLGVIIVFMALLLQAMGV